MRCRAMPREQIVPSIRHYTEISGLNYIFLHINYKTADWKHTRVSSFSGIQCFQSRPTGIAFMIVPASPVRSLPVGPGTLADRRSPKKCNAKANRRASLAMTGRDDHFLLHG